MHLIKARISLYIFCIATHAILSCQLVLTVISPGTIGGHDGSSPRRVNLDLDGLPALTVVFS